MSNFPRIFVDILEGVLENGLYQPNCRFYKSIIFDTEYLSLEEHQAIISDLESRLKIATEALEWYANEKHIEWQPCVNKEMSSKSLKSVECGTTAIEALEKIKEKRNENQS